MQLMGERVGTVGIIGGTGALGRGLAVRLAAAGHRVQIGSRDAGRASDVASQMPAGISGASNSAACANDFVVVAVPWLVHAETLAGLTEELVGAIVIDCVNPLGFDERGPFALSVEDGSATQQASTLLAASTVVGAFHHVAAELLLADGELDSDVLVVGDDRPAVDQVIELVDSISGLRGVYAGRLRNAGQVEALTANLIAINRRYRAHSGIRVTGIDASTAPGQ